MPYDKVRGHEDCSDSEPWAVVKADTKEVMGCHPTEEDADMQIAALYANEDESSSTESAGGKPNKGTSADRRLKENKRKQPKMTEELADKKIEEKLAAKVAPWEGVLTVEGVETGDGREFDKDALAWADLPLPLRWNIEDSHGGEPHTVAVNVGRIDEIWREDNMIMGKGVLDVAGENGAEAYRLVHDGFLKGVSVDVDAIKDADVELVYPEKGPDEGDDEDDLFSLFAMPEKVIFHAGRIRGATLVDIPAFTEAYIALTDEDVETTDEEIVIASVNDEKSLVAHAGNHDDWLPPSQWFSDPRLSVPTPITVTDEGRFYGHAAEWKTCHVGYTDMCVTPPREDYHPYFMIGEVTCSDGSLVAVGQVTLGTGHAPLYMSAQSATQHYDNTGVAVADVAVGNDEHGIWVAGAIRPGVDPARIRELRASGKLSGDWRPIGGRRRLVGLLAVNVPGFPIPRTATRIVNGKQTALIAAGVPSFGPPAIEANELEDLRRQDRKRQFESLKKHVKGE